VSGLVEERDFLLRSLRDLEAERAAGDIDPHDYRALKDDYTARAAAVIRELEGEPVAVPVAAPGPGRRRSWRTPVAVFGVIGLAVLTGWAVASSSGERQAGQAATGNVALAPNSTEARLAQARKLFGEKKVLDAVRTYDDILKTDPNQPEALAYKGWLLYLAGLADPGLESVTKATTAVPSYPDAHFFRAMILCDAKHDGDGAIAEYRAFFANVPPTGFDKGLEAQVQQRLDAALTGGCKA
jgi:tetratricopeptide (TPR) repeat protein